MIPNTITINFVYVGWEEQQCIFNLILHFDIKDGNILIQHNGTEAAIAQVLIEQGVPASDIVLGFHYSSINSAKFYFRGDL